MKIKTTEWGEITLGPGCVIALNVDTHLVMLLVPRDIGNEVICWPNGDDKRIAPSCIRTSEDFEEVVDLVANLLGLTAVRVSRPEQTDRLAYRLVERM
jgi:hypothetical protein